MRGDTETAQGFDPTATTLVPFGELLVEAGLVERPAVLAALAEGTKTSERLGEVLVRKGLVSEEDVARQLARQWGLEYVERSSIWFDSNALARLAREDAQRLEVLPTRIEGGRVVVAVAEPTERRLQALRELIGEETIVIVVPKSALDAGLRSELLRSAGRPSTTVEDVNAASAVSQAAHVGAPAEAEADQRGGIVTEPALEPVLLASVTPLRVRPPENDPEVAPRSAAVTVPSEEAHAAAERLADQAATIQAQQQELEAVSRRYESRIQELQDDLDRRTDWYQSRIDELERERDRRAEQLDRIRDRIADLVSAWNI